MTTKEKNAVATPKMSENLVESIKAIIEEFDKVSSMCSATPDDVVGLLLRAYEEGYYGSFEAREEAVLRLLKEFVDTRFKAMESSKKDGSKTK